MVDLRFGPPGGPKIEAVRDATGDRPLAQAGRRVGGLVLLVGIMLAIASPRAAAAPPASLELAAGRGETFVIERSPFRFSVRQGGGSERVGSVRGLEGPPVSIPGIDGPAPVNPLGTAGGYPAIGFVYGTSPGLTFPASFFQGNRLFGAEAGALASLVEVERVLERTASRLVLDVRTDAPSLPPARMTVVRLDGGGVRISLDPPAGPVAPVGTAFTLASPRAEGLYGLGARKDSFNQRGELRNVWTEQQNATTADGQVITGSDPTRTTGPDYTFPNGAQAAYYVQAALHGSRGWAAWVSQSELSRLDLAKTRTDAVRWGVASPELTLSLAGGGLEDATRSYTADVGRAPAPPRYAFEPWIDVINEGEGEAAPNGQGFTGGERVRSDLEMIARKVRRTDVPIGTLGVEGWQEVPGREQFFPALRRQGFHLSAYWNPFTSEGTDAYEEAKAKDLFVEDAAGNDYPIVTNRGGISFLIDYSDPAAQRFWTEQIARSSRLGFEAFMHDFGELVTEGMRFHNGELPPEMHNHYPVLYHEAARRALDDYAAQHPGFNPFFYVRSGFSGVDGSPGVIGYTPSVFPGDETTDFTEGSGIPSVPPAMLNLAMGGSYAFTTDVGGYLDLLAPSTSKELFIRWSQLAALTAISRIHNSTAGGSRYPWSYDDQTLRIYRRYAKAKVRLIPLVQRWSRRAATRGDIGPVRPLVLDDSSRSARSIDDEWLLGRDILAAPVLEEGATERRVYLPRGSRWRRVVVSSTGRFTAAAAPVRGGRTVTAPAPLRDIPIFTRVGSAQDPGGGAGAGGSGGGSGSGTGDGNDGGSGAGGDGGGGAGGGGGADAGAGSDTGSPTGRATLSAELESGDAGSTGSLPFTGLELVGMLAVGGALIVAGWLARRSLRAG